MLPANLAPPWSSRLPFSQKLRRQELGEGTVKRHLSNTYQKMGVSSRGEATRMALFEEWITIQDVTDDLDYVDGSEGKG